MLTNIQSLFADILQTPQQRAMQLTSEGLNRAELATRGLSGGAAMLSPLIAAEARTAPMREEMLSRSLGRLFGQDVRTESESIQNTLSQADTSTPEGQQALITALRNQGYGAQAAQLQQQMMAEQQQQQAAAAQAQQQEFENTLQSMNYQLDVAQFGETQATNLQARRLAEAQEARAAGTYETEIQKQQREQRESEALRASNVAIINSSPTIPAQMKANLSRAALSGLFDQNPEEIYKIAYGNDEIVTFGGVAYNASAARRGESDTWLTVPKAPTNLAETILSDLDPAKFTPESIAQALTLFNQATTPVDQNTALSVLQLQSSSDPSNSVKILSSDLAMDVTAYNNWVRGGKQGEPDFWIKAPTAAETGTDAFSAIIEDLPWGNYTPESISTWLAAQDTAVTSLEKADTIRLLQPARSGTSTAALTPAILQAEEAATTSSSQAGRMLSLSTQFDTAMGSGSSARMGALWRTFTGNSSDADAMRLELRAIQNTFVLANLPSGSSSDADVALARSTTPDEFNDPELINSWLRGQAKMAAMAAEYNLFKADYLNKNQNPAGLSRAWEEQRNAPGYRENIESKYGFKFNPDADREATRAAATQGRN
jgi:hypothetical protein